MIFVRAGSNRDGDIGTARRAELGRHIGLNLELRNRVDGRGNRGGFEEGSVVVGTVERVVRLVAAATGDGEGSAIQGWPAGVSAAGGTGS